MAHSKLYILGLIKQLRCQYKKVQKTAFTSTLFSNKQFQIISEERLGDYLNISKCVHTRQISTIYFVAPILSRPHSRFTLVVSFISRYSEREKEEQRAIFRLPWYAYGQDLALMSRNVCICRYSCRIFFRRDIRHSSIQSAARQIPRKTGIIQHCT